MGRDILDRRQRENKYQEGMKQFNECSFPNDGQTKTMSQLQNQYQVRPVSYFKLPDDFFHTKL